MSDFGLSKIVLKETQTESYEMTGLTGTFRYMAPEVMVADVCSYNEKVDIYSFGLILWSIATGERPMEEIVRLRNHKAFLDAVMKKEFRPPIDRIVHAGLANVMKISWQGPYEVRG